MEILGLDIGGSSVKAAMVDTFNGALTSEVFTQPTPEPANPANVATTVGNLIDQLSYSGSVGCSFPTVVKNGTCLTAGNISEQWVGVQIEQHFAKHVTSCTFHAANDADLAGIAEMTHGAGKNLAGKVIVITIGTGLGSGVFHNGRLIPNFELGRMFHPNGKLIEFVASGAAKTIEKLSLSEWAERFNYFLNHVERICTPDHLIIGGGLSERFEEFNGLLDLKTEIHVAKFRNASGIIGAAMFASQTNLLR